MKAPNLPDSVDILQAANSLRGLVHRTPVMTSSSLDAAAGCRLFFKCENLQRAGAFKFRGACNALAAMSAAELARGVATHSSGNHGAALALAARLHGCRAHVVMPRGTVDAKKRAVQSYGGIITDCEAGQEEREAALRGVVAETGAHFVPPYDDRRIIAGQATAAMELLEDAGPLDCIVAPLGGGGLLSGTSLAARSFAAGVQVLGAEPAGADDAFRSLRDGRIHPSLQPRTVCDGLRTSLGELTFAVLRECGTGVLRVEDAATIAAMKLLWERMKLVVEVSSAIVLAAVLEDPERFRGKRVGLILSGGNVDLGNLPW